MGEIGRGRLGGPGPADGAAHGVGPAFGDEREAGSGTPGPRAGGRPPRRRGILSRGAGRDADGAALGPDGPLQRTLRTTNIIENLNGGVERYTRNVKRWRAI